MIKGVHFNMNSHQRGSNANHWIGIRNYSTNMWKGKNNFSQYQ